MKRHTSDGADRLSAELALNSPDLLRYLQRRLDTDDAADALAEFMMVAWRRVDALPTDSEPARMWMFGIARNIVANAARSERRRWSLAERFRAVLEVAPTEGRPADEGIEVRDAIARLSPDQAELVRLVHWEGFSIADAGEILGLTASTTRTRYQRARADLKAALSLHVDRF